MQCFNLQCFKYVGALSGMYLGSSPMIATAFRPMIATAFGMVSCTVPDLNQSQRDLCMSNMANIGLAIALGGAVIGFGIGLKIGIVVDHSLSRVWGRVHGFFQYNDSELQRM